MRQASFRPSLESLSDRLVPSTVAVVNGELQITGTTGADRVIVSQVGSQYRVADQVTGIIHSIAVSQITSGKVTFSGGASGDRFENRTSLRAVAYGGGGSDTLIGGSGDDSLSG